MAAVGLRFPPPPPTFPDITITITEIPEWRNGETLTLSLDSRALGLASTTAMVEDGTATFTANIAPGTYRIGLYGSGGGLIAWDQSPGTRIDAGVNTIRFNDGNLIQ